jgi:hypothetical protein
MDYRLAADPAAMTRTELDELIRTRAALARAQHDADAAARAVNAVSVDDPARERLRVEARQARLRVAELEQAMIAHGWWTEEQRTMLLTDDGLVVVREPAGVGPT